MGCAHSNGLKITSEEPVSIQTAGQTSEPTLLKSNEVSEVTGDAVVLSAPGKIPMYLVNPTHAKDSGTQPLKVSLKSLEEWKPTQTDRFITSKMDDLYIQLFDILQNARNQKPQEALVKIQKITESYPKLASAYYVKAQIEVVLGDVTRAIASLDLAVKLRPEFQDAIQLKERLKIGRKL